MSVKVFECLFKNLFKLHKGNSRGRHFERVCGCNICDNVDTRKSLLEFVLIFLGTTITWKVNQQSEVELSTTQDKYIFLVEWFKEVI